MSIPMTDHLGHSFKSRSAMAEAWGIDQSTLVHRLKLGWSIKDALTTLNANRTLSRDHLGRDYPSLKNMAAAWKVPYNTLLARLDKGWSIEACLTGYNPDSPVCAIAVTDHTGRKFPSLHALATAWGVPFPRLAWRIRHGWSVEDAVTVGKGGQRRLA